MSEPIKTIFPELWVFDIETVPCVETGRKVYGLTGESDDDVLDHMYEAAGASENDPHPFLKTVLQRVVAISFLRRRVTNEGLQLSIHSLPADGDDFDERTMIETFLTEMGKREPQIVGFNHSGFDIPALFQRAVVHGIPLPKFCVRPNKPWDLLPDYFSDRNDWNVDLKNVIGGWGKATPSLVEIARACGIPAKFEAHGSDVATMWLAGRRELIVNYCETDVLSTYLLWLRTAMVSGLMNEAQMYGEELRMRNFLHALRDSKPHLGSFVDAWENVESEFELEAAA